MSTEKVTADKPVLVLLYGFPGSGKTHFANQMSQHFNCAHVHSDRIRHELFEEPRYDEQENGIVTHLMEYMTDEFLKAGVSVIYDVNAMRKTQRRALREAARKKGVKTLVVWFQVDAETSYGRLKRRDRRTADDKYAVDYTREEFKSLASKMQHPEAIEEYVVVSGKHTFPSQRTAFFKKLMEMKIIDSQTAQSKVAKPGLINLVPNSLKNGRVDMSRRNIRIG